MQLYWPALIFSAALLGLGYGAIAISASTPNACLTQTCGDIKVGFPFKLANATACPSFSASFDLDCDPVSGRLLFTHALVDGSAGSPIPVINLTADSLVLDVSAFNASVQIGSDRTCQADFRTLALPASPSPFVFSDENNLAGIGCGGAALLAAANSSYTDAAVGHCDVICSDSESSYACGGNKCCVFPWPSGLFPRRIVYSTVQDIANDTDACPFSYAVPFHSAYSDLERQLFAIKLNWALPSNYTTSLAIKGSPEYACAKCAKISMAQEIPGYRCSCRSGYTGDGYAQGSNCTAIGGCFVDEQDQECMQNCYHRSIGQLVIVISTIWGLLFLAVAIVVGCFCCRMMRRKQCPNETCGLESQGISTVKAIKQESTRLFKEEELITATDNYSSNMKLGEGGSCSVFKGVLADGRVVAIKKTKKIGNSVHLLNELKIMVQINHKNIARFLGCCLETAEPLLVYEFVENGNVYQNLRRDDDKVMSWEQRLKVAAQTADTLTYLHGVAVPPILHRDVKSSNVLLDSSFDAKVTDFGVSRLMEEDGAQAPRTALRGTIGYVDPEYFQTFELTEKSDVYSFGVLLAELVTGLKPVDPHSREPRFANLAFLFTHYMRDRASIQDLVDPRLLIAHDHRPRILSSVLDLSALTLQCLSLRGSQRPLMSKVARELARIRHAYAYNLELETISAGLHCEPSAGPHSQSSATTIQV